jgi:nucleoside-diphosphate-sugar epimerase
MPVHKNIFLTGVTGFVGSHLAVRLLREGHRLSVLARGSKGMGARDRVAEALQNAGAETLGNLEVFEGDIAMPGLGLDEKATRRITSSVDEVWHCAASLSFQEEDREEIFRMNAGGTRNVLELVERTPTRRLHHVSTAYVAGARAGVALETEIDVGQKFKNPYEESKCLAEKMIAHAHGRRHAAASVYRPSIVIGDSRSGRVTHFHGVYAFIRGLWGALHRLRRRSPDGGLLHFPLRVLGSENETLNFVPIDYVVDGMVEIARRPASLGNTYHLANPVPTENGLWLRHVCGILGVEGIRFAGESAFVKTPMTKLETLFRKQMAFYYQYLQGEPRFDCNHTLDALKSTGIECPPVTSDFIHRMIGWYVEFLKASRAEG